MIRLFKHYVPHSVLYLGVIDFLLLLAAGEAGWLLRLWQIGGQADPADSGRLPHLFVFAVVLQLAMVGVGAYGVDAWLYRTERNRRHAEQAHRWFEHYGTPVVFFSRLVPIVRTFISLPAGVARMPLGRFSLLTILGCLPWSLLLVSIGDAAGANWDTWHRRLGSLDYVVVAAGLVAVGVWLLRRRRSAAR